jgi:uncharacterized RDD family membrane protein YckC
MSGPEPGTTPTPEAPQPASWTAPPAGPAKDAGPAPGVAYADLGIRMGGFVIDAVIFFIAFWIFAAVVLTALAFGTGFGGLVLGFVLLTAFNTAFSAIYFIYGWTKLRASPGQKMLGLETVNAADGATLTQPQAIRRWLFLFGPFVALSALQWVVGAFLGLVASLVSLGYLIYLIYTTNQDPKRQGFHDHQADTVVVRRAA